MVVQVKGQSYRVQFVHSAHDLKTSRASAYPGGLRQIVDNLAASLRRRVTLAEIAKIEVIPEPYGDGKVLSSFVPVSQGFAVCYHGDHFVKEEGRGRAILRALRLSPFTKPEQNGIAVQLGYSGGLAELKDRFDKYKPTVETTIAPRPSASYLTSAGETSAPSAYQVYTGSEEDVADLFATIFGSR